MANKKAEILTMDGQVVSPITLATNVLLDDGRTAQDLLDSRDESMFSPTITTSSSISKVGQGDNVDFSDNVIDGAYGSCVLKGKTLVNYNAEGNDRNEYVCMPSVEGSNLTVNDSTEGLVKSAILKGQTLVNIIDCLDIKNYTLKFADMTITDGYVTAPYVSGNQYITITKDKMPLLKANTEYTLIVEIKDMSCGGVVVNHSFLGSQKNIFTDTTILTLKNTGIHTFKRTTKSELDDTFLSFCLHPTFNAIPGEITFRFMLLEGDYTNVDIPYFEGMQSVKMPVLTTTGKNTVFKVAEETLAEDIDPNTISKVGYAILDNTGFWCLSFGKSVWTRCYGYDKDWNYTESLGSQVAHQSSSFSLKPTNQNTKYIKFRFWDEVNPQLEKSSTATTYEPYKSNILSCNEEVTLRGIGDVKDMLDCNTGELTQRIGEVVLDGSEDWVFGRGTTHATNGQVFGFKIQIPNLYVTKWDGTKADTIVCDKLKVTSQFNQFTGEVYNSISQCSPTEIQIMIKAINNSLNDTLNEIKRMLSENPVTVVYPVNDVIKTVDLSDNVVYSYKDTTHYTCSSEEGSLIPTLTIEEGVKYKAIIKPSTKYSIVFNRTEVASGLTVDLGGATANIVSTTLGKNIVQITTPSTLSHNYVIFKGLGNAIKDVQVIEGDVVGDEPYFEGMIDVKNPIITNCNSPIIFGKGGRL